MRQVQVRSGVARHLPRRFCECPGKTWLGDSSRPEFMGWKREDPAGWLHVDPPGIVHRKGFRTYLISNILIYLISFDILMYTLVHYIDSRYIISIQAVNNVVYKRV